MKKTIYFASILSAGLLAASCSDDDNSVSVNAAVESTFEAKYPNVNKVDWDLKSTYYVAEFAMENSEMEAWFSQDGNWIYTETDLAYQQLPEVIRNSFEAGEYASWEIDDVDKVERPEGESLFIMEVESGDKELDLYFTDEGELIKVSDSSLDDDYIPLPLSEAILSHLADKYPNAVVVESELEDGVFEILIKDGDTYREVEYSENGTWIKTTTDVKQANVPEAVMTALANSEYAAYEIDDVEFVETADAEFYLFELEQNDTEVYLKISADGTIITE
ncbi:hypothetical protein D1614_13885 [Maribellus luteus]|uniref:Putative beta-lactamase-inhibitor-like PepSY-like domain-containing protein n=1 Tax=Maribellus luteus TaxID=2305463 RepID=A0A399SUG9_9BACT|nr:PepSY-like domain-containing protein [Maribellus luteus]RIJ47666.1 hypothetical protein D1614_13885 [Maribellus luteus]